MANVAEMEGLVQEAWRPVNRKYAVDHHSGLSGEGNFGRLSICGMLCEVCHHKKSMPRRGPHS